MVWMDKQGAVDSCSAIYEAVCANPGIHKSELCRITGYSWSTVGYHLKSLHPEFIRASRHGGKLHLAAATYAPDIYASHSLLLPHSLAVLKVLADHSPLSAADIRRSLELGAKLTRKHLLALVSDGLLHSDGSYHPRYSLSPRARFVMGRMRTPGQVLAP